MSPEQSFFQPENSKDNSIGGYPLLTQLRGNIADYIDDMHERNYESPELQFLKRGKIKRDLSEVEKDNLEGTVLFSSSGEQIIFQAKHH